MSVLLCPFTKFVAAQEFISPDLDTLEAYLEPIKEIEVSTVETGIIDSIQVREGDIVTRGQTLVRLNKEVLEKAREIAEAESSAVGSLKTAKAELKLKEKRFSILKKIFDKGHGRASEMERAQADVEVARGRVLRAEEEILIRQKQLIQIKAKIAARDIVSPIDGIVTEIHKDPGEAVSPTNPVLVTVVNIDQLKCVFAVPRKNAGGIRNSQSVVLSSANHPKIPGTVQWKSPIVHADSETIKVIIRVDNRERTYTSGEHCILTPPKVLTKNTEPNQSVSLRKRSKIHNDRK